MTEAANSTEQTSTPLGLKTWLAVVAVALTLYVATAQRTVSWQDSGEFQWRCLTGDLVGTMGLARAHPLYMAVGAWLARLAGPAMPLAINVFSGLGMAVALGTFAAICCRLTGSRAAALLMTALLGVCHTVWWLSTIAEVYTWSLAALAAEIYFLLRLLDEPRAKWLALLALANGLGLCVHNFALLGLPVYLVVVIVLLARRKLRPMQLLPAVAFWFLSAGLYIGMTIDVAIRTGSVLHAVRSALVGDYAAQVTNVGRTSRHIKANAALSAMNFISPLLPLAVLGWWQIKRWRGRGMAAAVLAITVIHVVFFVRYPVPDQFTFILPSLMLIAIAASVALAWLLRRSRRWQILGVAVMLASIFCQPLIFLGAAGVARRTNAAQRQRKLPFRDEARYWLIPWKHDETSAHRFAAAAFDEVAPNALIVADSTSVYPLMTFQRLHNVRSDVVIQYDGWPLEEPITAETLRGAAMTRAVYVVSPGRIKSLEEASTLRMGVLFKVMPRVPSPEQ